MSEQSRSQDTTDRQTPRPEGFKRPGAIGRPGGGHGPGGFGRPVEKAKDFKGTLRRLVAYLKPFRINLLIVLLFAVTSTVFAIASPKVQGNAINKMTDGYMAKMLLGEMGKMQRNATDGIYRMAEGLEDSIPDQMWERMQLVKISSLAGEAEKKAAVIKLFDALEKIQSMGFNAGQGATGHGDAGQGAASQGVASQGAAVGGQARLHITPEAAGAIRGFLRLPMLDTLTDPDQKADVVEEMITLGKNIGDFMQDMIQGAQPEGQDGQSGQGAQDDLRLQSRDFTQEQVDAALKAIRETDGRIDFDYILRIIIILLVMYIFSALFQFIMQWVMSGVAQKTSYKLREDVDRKLARLPLKYFDSKTHGEILSRVTNDVDTISSTLQQSITQVITAVIQIIGYVIMMLVTSPMLTLLVLVTLPLYVLVTTIIAKRSQKFFAAQQKELGELSGHVEEMYTGHKIIKAFGYEEKSIGRFMDVNDRLYSAGWKAQFISGIMFPLMNFISNIGYVLICVFGGMWMTQNRLRLGDITAFIQYSRSFTYPIVQTSNIANTIQSTIACAERVFEILDEQEQLPDSVAAALPGHPTGEVTFENVNFSYMENEQLIENMNLSLKPGETIAIVGPTGAGKTTLVNLLMRFYEIKDGSIKIDGVDIRDFRRHELRSMFGMVLQDTWLFNGTIRDNIAYGREGASEEEIVRAAKAAHADHFIRTLPQGYDTVLNEEATNISQGQKQLLTIARAILANPVILILDEATSSVDTRTELLIQKAMGNLMKNRTSFIIAHRLSTIRDARLILVMNHGRIVEQGNHRELLDKGGFYADLYNSQFTGADLGDAV